MLSFDNTLDKIWRKIKILFLNDHQPSSHNKSKKDSRLGVDRLIYRPKFKIMPAITKFIYWGQIYEKSAYKQFLYSRANFHPVKL